MPPVTTNLSQEDADYIDHLAADVGLSRSAWIREAILIRLYGGPITPEHEKVPDDRA